MTQWLSILSLGLVVAGCAAPRGRGLADDDASYKIPAIKTAVEQNDEKAIPQLILDLDSDDSAVRFYAIEGLRRLTGESFGYRFFDPVADRRMPIERWKAWQASREK